MSNGEKVSQFGDDNEGFIDRSSVNARLQEETNVRQIIEKGVIVQETKIVENKRFGSLLDIKHTTGTLDIALRYPVHQGSTEKQINYTEDGKDKEASVSYVAGRQEVVFNHCTTEYGANGRRLGIIIGINTDDETEPYVEARLSPLAVDATKYKLQFIGMGEEVKNEGGLYIEKQPIPLGNEVSATVIGAIDNQFSIQVNRKGESPFSACYTFPMKMNLPALRDTLLSGKSLHAE